MVFLVILSPPVRPSIEPGVMHVTNTCLMDNGDVNDLSLIYFNKLLVRLDNYENLTGLFNPYDWVPWYRKRGNEMGDYSLSDNQQ